MPNIHFVELRHRGLLRVGGAEARSFLQSLISNDMGPVDHDTGIYGALLTPQGKYLHDLFVCQTKCPESGDQECFLVDADRPADFLKRLGMYKLRADVTLERLEDWGVYTVFGSDLFHAPGVRQVAGDVRALGEDAGGARYMTDPRNPRAGLRAYAPRASAEAMLSQLEAQQGSLADFDQTRICAGLPDGCRDVEVEKSTLLENRFDELNAISWTKGCFVGQEVTARMKYRNSGKRQLYVVDLEGPAPDKGVEVKLNGEKVGVMRTSVPGVGLAFLRNEAVEQYIGSGGDFLAGRTIVTPRVLDETVDAVAVG